MKENFVYPIRVVDENGKYNGRFLDFPDICLIESDSREELLHSAQESLALEILDYESRNQELPTPSEEVNGVIFIHVWMPYFRNASKEIYVKKNVTIPQWLDILAKENKVNYSAALVRGIKMALGIEH